MIGGQVITVMPPQGGRILFEIVAKKQLSNQIWQLDIHAPLVAAKARPGQFVVVRAHDKGERIPLSISDFDSQAGHITLVVQAIGHSTTDLVSLEVGEKAADLLGPLGTPAEIDNFGTVVCVAGGVATAIIYPEARAFQQAGNKVITLLGARSADLFFYEDELRQCSDEVRYATEDGSRGKQGFVTELLQELIDAGEQIDRVVAIGPVPMMRAVCELTRPYQIKTVVSLNPIMVDGTGMCGACRVEVGGETRFCCTDGPEFDGHLVDFAALQNRSRQYQNLEEKIPHHHSNGGCAGQCQQ